MSIVYHDQFENEYPVRPPRHARYYVKLSVRAFIFWILVSLVIGFNFGMSYSSWTLRRSTSEGYLPEGAKANGVAGYQGSTEVPEIMSSDLQTEAAPAPPPVIRLRITHYYAACDKNTASMLTTSEAMKAACEAGCRGFAAIGNGPHPLAKDWYERVKTGDYAIVDVLTDDPGGAITAGRYLICDRCPEPGILDIYTGVEDVGYLYAYYSDVVEIKSEETK